VEASGRKLSETRTWRGPETIPVSEGVAERRKNSGPEWGKKVFVSTKNHQEDSNAGWSWGKKKRCGEYWQQLRGKKMPPKTNKSKMGHSRGGWGPYHFFSTSGESRRSYWGLNKRGDDQLGGQVKGGVLDSRWAPEKKKGPRIGGQGQTMKMSRRGSTIFRRGAGKKSSKITNWSTNGGKNNAQELFLSFEGAGRGWGDEIGKRPRQGSAVVRSHKGGPNLQKGFLGKEA